jgi:Ferroportin1 (FPN1)
LKGCRCRREGSSGAEGSVDSAILSILLTINLVINAQMRRIDLMCKLMGPLFIALIDGISTEVAILVNLGMNVASVIVEYFAIAKVRFTTVMLSLFSLLSPVHRFTMRYQNCNSPGQSCKKKHSIEQQNMKAALHTTGGTSKRSYKRVHRILVSTSITRLSYPHSLAPYYI